MFFTGCGRIWRVTDPSRINLRQRGQSVNFLSPEKKPQRAQRKKRLKAEGRRLKGEKPRISRMSTDRIKIAKKERKGVQRRKGAGGAKNDLGIGNAFATALQCPCKRAGKGLQERVNPETEWRANATSTNLLQRFVVRQKGFRRQHSIFNRSSRIL